MSLARNEIQAGVRPDLFRRSDGTPYGLYMGRESGGVAVNYPFADMMRTRIACHLILSDEINGFGLLTY